MNPIGIIGGSGFYDYLKNPRMFIHNNRYGRSSEIFEGELGGRKVFFLPRHGAEHEIIVPRINYRANIWAFKELGVQQILATNCVGSSNPDFPLGSLVIPHDFFDWTRRFPRSLYDDVPVAYHVDMTPAYCPVLRDILIQCAKAVRPERVIDHGVIFVNEGLRFETPFELQVFRKMGADLIGMTTLPEAVFAREAALCYAHICIPTNWCLGEAIEADDFPTLLQNGVADFKKVLERAVPMIPDARDCPCSHALDHAILEKSPMQ